MGRTIDRILDNIDLMEYMRQCGFTPVPIGSCYTLKEHDSVRIFPESNTYFHSSRSNKRLNVINFVEWHFNMSNYESIKKLASELNKYPDRRPTGSFENRKKNSMPKEKIKLVLPEKSQEQYKRTFAYLTKTRGIHPAVVQDVVDKKMLYEDERGNATFVNYYQDNEPSFCFQRGTSQKPENTFKRIVAGSDFTQGWYLHNGAKKLFVTEAIIDNLSIMTMLKKYGLQYKDYDYLATCGTSLQGLLEQVKQRPEMKTIYLAFDNDTAGNNYRNKARKELYQQGFKGKIIDKPPVQKDFNMDLLHTKIPTQKMPNKLQLGGVSR